MEKVRRRIRDCVNKGDLEATRQLYNQWITLLDELIIPPHQENTKFDKARLSTLAIHIHTCNIIHVLAICAASFVECFLSSGLREHPSRNAKLSYAAVAKRSQDPRGRGVDQEEARVQGETEGKRQQVACQNPGACTQMASWQLKARPEAPSAVIHFI